MTRPRLHPLRSALAGLCLLVLGCSSTLSPPPRTSAATASSESSDQVMVTLKTTHPRMVERVVRDLAIDYGLSVVAVWEMASLESRCAVFRVSHPRARPRTLDRLSSDHRVDLVEPIRRYTVQSLEGTEDTYRHLQRNLEILHLDAAHRMATGKGVRIAVVDTGIDFSHPDLRGRISIVQNFVESEGERFASDIHGTAVAGVIGAAAHNGQGILGVAPEANLMALKACWPRDPEAAPAVCDSYTIAQALDFAIVNEAQVLNMSLAGPHDSILSALIERALERGILVVAATSDHTAISFPASLDGVLGVRSVEDEAGGDVTNRGNDLSAPGKEILTTFPQGAYDFISGSSLAAAQVSGIAALLLEHRPDLDPGQIRTVLHASANDNPGLRVVDACAALRQLMQQPGSCD